MTDPEETSGGAPRALAVGTKVEVRRRYDHRWARGFEVAAVNADGYLVRRSSDATVLPAPFSRPELRRERQGSWWY